MSRVATILALLIFCLLAAQGQGRLVHLNSKLLSADSIIIVSHESTAGVSVIDSVTGKYLPHPKLLIKGKLNEQIIHERTTLLDTAVKRLSSIITRPFQDTVIEIGKCFLPHHAIVAFKSNRTSFIDICFGCRRIATSKDIKIVSDDFDNRKWKELIDFFQQYNMRYELSEEPPQDE